MIAEASLPVERANPAQIRLPGLSKVTCPHTVALPTNITAEDCGSERPRCLKPNADWIYVWTGKPVGNLP
jgi:hypothetical protein